LAVQDALLLPEVPSAHWGAIVRRFSTACKNAVQEADFWLTTFCPAICRVWVAYLPHIFGGAAAIH